MQNQPHCGHKIHNLVGAPPPNPHHHLGLWSFLVLNGPTVHRTSSFEPIIPISSSTSPLVALSLPPIHFVQTTNRWLSFACHAHHPVSFIFSGRFYLLNQDSCVARTKSGRPRHSLRRVRPRGGRSMAFPAPSHHVPPSRFELRATPPSPS